MAVDGAKAIDPFMTDLMSASICRIPSDLMVQY
jgi:hypothetical protein